MCLLCVALISQSLSERKPQRKCTNTAIRTCKGRTVIFYHAKSSFRSCFGCCFFAVVMMVFKADNNVPFQMNDQVVQNRQTGQQKTH